MEIKPVNAPAKYSFIFSEISEIKIADYLPDELKNLGWCEALNEINRHWQIISKAKIWSPYPIQSYAVGAAQAPSLSNVLSGNDSFISSLLQDDINEWSKVRVRYYLFPLLNSQNQSQAVAQLICETLPNKKIGELTVWIDALQKDELSPQNISDISLASRQINI